MANGRPWGRHDGKVAPEPGSCDNIVEIRPKRTLHIKHVNPKRRDEKFEKEMQTYLQYRESAVIGTYMPSNVFNQRQKSNIRLKSVNGSSLNKESNSQPPHIIGERESMCSAGTDGCKTNDKSKDKSENAEESTETQISRGSTAKLQSPALSLQSQSVQSVSGVHVNVTRPSSLIKPLDEIREKVEKNSHLSTHTASVIEGCPKSSQSPRKTKGHRPISAKSVKTGPRSLASSDVSDTQRQAADLEALSQTHLSSPFKDVSLFFIHGVGGSADIWNHQINYFGALGLEIIAPDLLGHGFSQSPDVKSMYHFNEILADLEAIFDKYCKRQNIVIGHSYGCAFAAALGRRRSRRVTKLVLISGGAPIPLAPQPGVFSLPVCMLSCIQPCLNSRFERNAFHDAKHSGLSREQAFDVPVYVLSHMMLGQDWLDGDELYHQWLSAPTLLLHGKFDNFVTVKEEEAMERAIHMSQLVVIDNASHMVMMEEPDEVNRVMYEFFFQETHQPNDYDDARSIVSSVRSKKFSKSLA